MAKGETWDRKVGKAFDSRYAGEPKEANLDTFVTSTRLHVEHILSRNPESVLGVGMGAGGILLALQNRGIKHIYGIDLSSKAIELATKRFELFGDMSSVNFYNQNIADLELTHVDAISIHQVLLNNPDYRTILKSCVELSPSTIAITEPKPSLMNKIRTPIGAVLTRIILGMRLMYYHSFLDINQYLIENDYVKSFEHNSKFGKLAFLT